MSAHRYVVMGVAGSGKTVVGTALAAALGVAFVEGDDHHPPENRAKMAAGVPLDDEDRRGWLDALAARIAEARRADAGLVVSCSALKRRYRDRLREADPELRFVHLSGGRELIAARLAARRGHFMPPSMLDSQLATLETPEAAESVWVQDVSGTPAEIVAAVLARGETP